MKIQKCIKICSLIIIFHSFYLFLIYNIVNSLSFIILYFIIHFQKYPKSNYSLQVKIISKNYETIKFW